MNKYTDPYQNMDLDCDAPTLIEVSNLIRGFSGREISKLFTGLQTHICAHMKGAQITSRNLKLTRRTIIDVVKQKIDEHGRTIDVLAKGYEYVHQEQGVTPSVQGTPLAGSPFGSGNYGNQMKAMQKLLPTPEL